MDHYLEIDLCFTQIMWFYCQIQTLNKKFYYMGRGGGELNLKTQYIILYMLLWYFLFIIHTIWILRYQYFDNDTSSSSLIRSPIQKLDI